MYSIAGTKISIQNNGNQDGCGGAITANEEFTLKTQTYAVSCNEAEGYKINPNTAYFNFLYNSDHVATVNIQTGSIL